MLRDIFSVIVDQWLGVLGALLLVALGQILIGSALRNILGARLTSNEYLSLGMAGWMLPVSLLSLLWFLSGFRSTFLFILLIIAPILFLLRLKTDLVPDSKPIFIFLLFWVSISILLRLAFISKSVLPSYFDSAEHYALIKDILGNNTAGTLALPSRYYHLGFHVLAAFIASTFQTGIAKTMLILGQMVLAVIPMSVFFLIEHETGSNIAGVFAVILSAYGWYMPAHAVDWGKYPALMSMGLIPFAFSLAYLLTRHKNTLSLGKRRAFYLLLGAGILISGLAHSRSLVVFGIAFVAWSIAAWRQKLSAARQAIIFFMVIAILVLEIVFIQRQDVLLLLFDPYVPKGILVTALVLFLSVFAQGSYPQFTFACVLAACFLLGSLFIPVMGLIPGYGNLTLLDRPFVETILYLPLSLLGGLGLAGLEKTFQRAKISLLSRNGFIGLLACGSVWINASVTYDLYPSECCVIAGNDDMAAMTWMDGHLPAEARIGISATELKVMANESFEGYAGGDAGIWITPLINRSTIPLRYDSDFGEQATLDELCQMGISHLYVGEIGQTFDNSRLSAQPAWYKILLSMPEVKVYQVLGC